MHKRSIVILNKDLRITDNRALNHARKNSEETLIIYFLSNGWKKNHPWTGHARQRFLIQSLKALDTNLRNRNNQLFLIQRKPEECLEQILKETNAKLLCINQDPEPFGRNREQNLETISQNSGVEFRSFQDRYLANPYHPFKVSKKTHSVFSQYQRDFNKEIEIGRNLERIEPWEENIPNWESELLLKEFPSENHWRTQGVGLDAYSKPELTLLGGEGQAQLRLQDFIQNLNQKQGFHAYDKHRNDPTGRTTSQLSQDLRWGLLSIRDVWRVTQSAQKISQNAKSKFASELIWREFFAHVLANNPTALDQEIKPETRGLNWNQDLEAFERWKTGTTGFPFVDAAMRQLLATATMHNRLRMVTAMFLTKDLLIDWRKGEQHFQKHLLDGDLASNNGGWQWSASTGSDAADYLRIQNPWTQSARHDPQGIYIKTWLPELNAVAPEKLHEPPQNSLAPGYPIPIVNHYTQRKKAINLFSKRSNLHEND